MRLCLPDTREVYEAVDVLQAMTCLFERKVGQVYDLLGPEDIPLGLKASVISKRCIEIGNESQLETAQRLEMLAAAIRQSLVKSEDGASA